MVLTDSTILRDLSDKAKIEEFMKINSKAYGNVIGLSMLAKGGEAVVYTVNHLGTDEIVGKLPVSSLDKEGSDQVKYMYEVGSIIYESQILKMNALNSHICEIKEEIIEYNEEKKIITGYLVVVEQAKYSLQEVVNIWTKQKTGS